MRVYKRLFIIFTIMISLILPAKIFALEGSLNLSCAKNSLKPGEQITCNISYTASSGSLTGFQTNVNLSSNLELVSSSKNSAWEGSADNGNFYLYTANPKTGSIGLGTFSIKAKQINDGSSEAITLTNVILSDESFNDKKPGNKSLGVSILSNNADLNNLSVSSGSLSPSFNPDVTNYTVTTNDSTITISASSLKAQVSGTGAKQLNYGSNVFNIISTAPAGNTKTYKITVIRNDNRSKDNKLKSLTLSNGKIDFNSNTFNYNVTLDGSVSSFSVNAVPNDNKARISYSPSQSINLNYGQTSSISIIVTAENGSALTYKVNVTRKDNRSTNNTLKSLNISNTNIKFKSNITSYSDTVSNDISSIKIDATASDSKAKVSGIGNKQLKVGNNTFKVTVAAENGSIKVYVITIIRKTKAGEVSNLSSDNNLKSLSIDAIDIAFDKDKTIYNLSVENKVTKVDIKYELSSEKANVLLVGEDTLKVGSNKIDIIVTAENGDTKTYSLIIERKEERIVVSNDEDKIIEKINDNSNLDEIYVTVLYNDKNKTVSNKVLESLFKSKKSLIYEVYNKDKGISYSFKIDGNNLKKENKFSYNLTFKSDNESDLKKLVGKNNYLAINFNNGGKLNNKLDFKIFIRDKLSDLDSKYDLYYFNKENKKLEKLKENIDISSGYLDMKIDNLDEYVLLKHEVKKNNIVLISVLIITLIILLVALLFIGKKLSKKNKLKKLNRNE